MFHHDDVFSDYFLVGQENNQVQIHGGYLAALLLGWLAFSLHGQLLNKETAPVPVPKSELPYWCITDLLEQGPAGQTLFPIVVSDCGPPPMPKSPRYEDDSEEVIRFSELDGNRFDSGSAEINQTFAKGIREQVIPRAQRLVQKYGEGRVIVEAFGFTDGVPVRNTTGCTMDNRLVAFNQNGEAPSPCSNVELGKLRADTVAKQIRSELASVNLTGVRVLGYSAGQTVLPNKALATVADDGKNAPERRFVEVRFNITQ